jgi:hypothetical protein
MIGIRLGLFASGWWMSARLATSSRAAMQGLGLFNLGMGAGTALVGLRGALRDFLTYPFANLLSLGAIVVLWRAGQALMGERIASREQTAVLLLGGSLILWFGRSGNFGPQRVASHFLAGACVAVRGGWQGCDSLRRESLQPTAVALLAATWTTAAMFFWRAVVGPTSETRIEFNDASDTTHSLALVLRVAVFSLNMVFTQIVYGRATAELERLSRLVSLTGR